MVYSQSLYLRGKLRDDPQNGHDFKLILKVNQSPEWPAIQLLVLGWLKTLMLWIVVLSHYPTCISESILKYWSKILKLCFHFFFSPSSIILLGFHGYNQIHAQIMLFHCNYYDILINNSRISIPKSIVLVLLSLRLSDKRT